MTNNAAKIVEICDAALLSIVENTENAVSDGFVSEYVKKRDIIGVLALRRKYANLLDETQYAVSKSRLKALYGLLEEMIIKTGDIEKYSHDDGQIKQTVAYLPIEKILRAMKEIEQMGIGTAEVRVIWG